jgi:hypothetical protein
VKPFHALFFVLAACASDDLEFVSAGVYSGDAGADAETADCPDGLYLVAGECSTCEDRQGATCRTDDEPGWCVAEWTAGKPVVWSCRRWDAYECGGSIGCINAEGSCAPAPNQCPSGCCSSWHP